MRNVCVCTVFRQQALPFERVCASEREASHARESNKRLCRLCVYDFRVGKLADCGDFRCTHSSLLTFTSERQRLVFYAILDTNIISIQRS